MRFFRTTLPGLLAVTVIAAMPCSAEVLSTNLALTTITPCRLVDTRVNSQRMVASVTRTFDIYGGNLSAQGGSPSGCGIPGFASGVAQVQALAINFVAVSPDANGNLKAWPSDHAIPGSSILNYQKLTPNLNIANELPTSVRQDVAGGDFSVQASSGVDVVADVVGYYSTVPVASPITASMTTSSGGGVMSGKIALASGDNCPSGSLSTYGYATGVTPASEACPSCSAADFTLLSPQSTCTARDLAVKMIGGSGERSLTLLVNGQPTPLSCSASDGSAACNSGSQEVLVPPSSEIAMRIDQAAGGAPLCGVQFGFRCN